MYLYCIISNFIHPNTKIKKMKLQKIFNPKNLILYLDAYEFLNFLPDKLYLKIKFYLSVGKKLNLNNPKGFCEKLQWLKLYDRKDIYTTLVDKYKVRDFIKRKIGSKYLIPLLGVWDDPYKIDFNSLPDKFVLKCNHNSGEGMCLCTDKSKLDICNVRKKLLKSINKPYYSINRQWPYKNVKPLIISEKFMEDPNSKLITNSESSGLIDYKFYCFNGEPKFLYIGYANIINGIKRDLLTFLDLNWQNVSFGRLDHEKLDIRKLTKPTNFNEMIKISKILSEGIPFVRVDLYNINNNIYFSELTFSPGGGFGVFNPYEYEILFGSWIKI